MLTKAFQEQWATALESGKYKQGIGRLRTEYNQHCCLGVAVELVDPTAWVQVDGDGWYAQQTNGTARRCGFLPDFIRGKIGLSYEDERILSSKNDSGVLFPQIAAYIRSLPTRD